MREEERILQTIQNFIEAGLITHDVDKALALVSDQILGVGINEQGTVGHKGDLRRILEARNDTTSFQVAYPQSKVYYHPPGFATACVVYELHFQIDGKEVRNAFIQTVAARKEGDDWKLCLLQALPVELTGSSIENYPLKFADHTLMHLRNDLKIDAFQFLSSSLSVGILGSYIDETGLPPFYINESMLTMLGYTLEEFQEVMAEDSFAVVYTEDKERAQMEIAEAIMQKQDYTSQYRLVTKSGELRWIIEYGRLSKQDEHEVVLSAFVDITNLMQLQRELKEKNDTILSSLAYACKIQKNLLPAQAELDSVFQDHAVIWSPKDMVSGDIYWMKRFAQGTVLCVADCTGHGIPGALLTMLVSTTLDHIVKEENCGDPARLMYELDRHSAQLLHTGNHTDGSLIEIRDGCDIAVLFIARNGSVTFSSAGIPLFLSDGKEVRRYRGQRMHIGEGMLKGPEQVEKRYIPAGEHTFYLASDGLFDQIGGSDSRPFGYQNFQRLVLEGHGASMQEIAQRIWNAFEGHRGEQPRRDDLELIAFRL